jgi:enoyl-CoA hydratase/carnithine racemase
MRGWVARRRKEWAMNDCLLSRIEGSSLVLTLNRPDKHNALSGDIAEALLRTIKDLSDNRDIRGVVIQGAGAKAFSAGADLKERAAADEQQKWFLSRRLLDINKAILASPKIFYASISGWCLGGGLELALACDFRIADVTAKFGWPEVKLGAYPGAGAAVLLPRLIGAQRAKRFLLDPTNIDAAAAQHIGLVDDLADAGAATEVCLARLAVLESIAPLAQAAIKATLQANVALPLEEALKVDGEFRRPLEATADYQEGIRAHFEKRKARFVGA